MVYLVEDYQGAPALGHVAVQARPGCDLGVGHHDSVEVLAVPALGIRESRVQPDANAVGGIRPLALEMLRRGDDGNPVDDLAGEQFCSDPECECGLAGTRGGRGEKVPLVRFEVRVDGLLLPGAEFVSSASRGALRESRREVFCCRCADLMAERQGSAHSIRLYRHQPGFIRSWRRQPPVSLKQACESAS